MGKHNLSLDDSAVEEKFNNRRFFFEDFATGRVNQPLRRSTRRRRGLDGAPAIPDRSASSSPTQLVNNARRIVDHTVLLRMPESDEVVESQPTEFDHFFELVNSAGAKIVGAFVFVEWRGKRSAVPTKVALADVLDGRLISSYEHSQILLFCRTSMQLYVDEEIEEESSSSSSSAAAAAAAASSSAAAAVPFAVAAGDFDHEVSDVECEEVDAEFGARVVPPPEPALPPAAVPRNQAMDVEPVVPVQESDLPAMTRTDLQFILQQAEKAKEAYDASDFTRNSSILRRMYFRSSLAFERIRYTHTQLCGRPEPADPVLVKNLEIFFAQKVNNAMNSAGLYSPLFDPHDYSKMRANTLLLRDNPIVRGGDQDEWLSDCMGDFRYGELHRGRSAHAALRVLPVEAQDALREMRGVAANARQVRRNKQHFYFLLGRVVQLAEDAMSLVYDESEEPEVLKERCGIAAVFIEDTFTIVLGIYCPTLNF